MSWTGRLPAGVEYDQPVIALDVFPTALAAAGAPMPNGVNLDGVNLLPYLTGAVTEPASPPPHLALFWRFGQQWGVRHRDWKLVHAGPKSPVQLFNVVKDPGEQHDLAAAEPHRVRELRAIYDEWNAQNVPPLWKDSRKQ
jgi:arylsulfatase A-like enzyme